ncbi:MAG TPA: hypothetical protein VM347_12400 [Nonomuraea sp.]|nr:hypothetical protein [Nonomuraea sp.]
MDHITREEHLTLLQSGIMRLIETPPRDASAVRVHAGGKQDWPEAGLAFAGTHTSPNPNPNVVA